MAAATPLHEFLPDLSMPTCQPRPSPRLSGPGPITCSTVRMHSISVTTFASAIVPIRSSPRVLVAGLALAASVVVAAALVAALVAAVAAVYCYRRGDRTVRAPITRFASAIHG